MLKRLRAPFLACGALALLCVPALAIYPFPTPMLSSAAKLVTSAWNPADKNASFALSNLNFTATWGGSAAHGLVRGVKFASAGKLYFEIKDVATGATAQGTAIGAATSSASLSTYLGASAGIGYFNNGAYYNNGASGSGFAAYTTGDTLNIAVDLTNHLIYFGKNGTYTGNPSAGTGGISIASGSYAPTVDGYDNGTVFTLNTGGSSFANSIPSGFTAWQ